MHNKQTESSPSHIHYEDLALKQAVEYFGKELLPFFGIYQKAIAVLPTESVYLEAKQMYQDYNFLMEDGSIAHFEFESDALQVEDLRRFRLYEAHISYTEKRSVITYVVCSAKTKSLRQELPEGINVYHVQLIHLRHENADLFFQSLEEKDSVSREDLAKMLLTPLMSGNMSSCNRILQSINYLKKQSSQLTPEDISKIQSVLYALAVKFLSKAELNLIKEELGMTILGEMIYNDGLEKGLEQGLEQGILAVIRTCIKAAVPYTDIIINLMSEFSLTKESAEEYMKKYEARL